ncbi:MAG: Glu/Leu/Phe/Val dehydrogenase dimerization domain-containing protein [Porticoccaceae bacterium]|jgi:leucine dehydrogenase|nr:Glu/Leu/Phe/Val dehydrogenase dimerization domain-containing protein [Porticoccaceae bacterium]
MSDRAPSPNLFDLAASLEVPELHFCLRPELGLEAIVAIHSTARGPALGGCRCVPYPDPMAAVEDVMRLARAMSYKAAISDLPFGGGKSVVVMNPGLRDRAACFAAFGDFVHHLDGRYIVTEDSGTGIADMDVIATRTSHVLGTSPDAGGCGNPSPSTAIGVCAGIESAVRHRLGREHLDGTHVAIQGVGQVGMALAGELHRRGARITVADHNPQRAEACATRFGAAVVAPGDIHRVAADLFAPCGLGAILDEDTIPQLGAGIVAGSANNQLATAEDGRRLHERGILYAPDYVINAGGLIHVALWGSEDIQPRLAAIGVRLDQLFERAARTGERPELVADSMAEAMLVSK